MPHPMIDQCDEEKDILLHISKWHPNIYWHETQYLYASDAKLHICTDTRFFVYLTCFLQLIEVKSVPNLEIVKAVLFTRWTPFLSPHVQSKALNDEEEDDCKAENVH